MTRVTPLNAYSGHPSWSPDGAEIAFESTRSGTMELWTVPAEGGPLLRLTGQGGYWPSWSPDGESLVFCVWGGVQPDVWILDVAAP
jgi:TolB protein